MRKCVINKKTKLCVNIILLEDGEVFQSTSADNVLATRHDGEIGWQLVSGEWVYDIPVPVALTIEQLAAEARAKRNTLLAASDWTQVADAPVNKTAWAAYRQALRDITSQVGFPETINWPVAP